jgi:hypothetical protein
VRAGQYLLAKQMAGYSSVMQFGESGIDLQRHREDNGSVRDSSSSSAQPGW